MDELSQPPTHEPTTAPGALVSNSGKQDAKTDLSTNETAAAEIGKVAEAFKNLFCPP
jgi:hypothetical protein